MRQLNTILAIFAVLAGVGMVAMFLITTESISAWHQSFDSKKACVDFFKAGGNSQRDANFACQKLLGH